MTIKHDARSRIVTQDSFVLLAFLSTGLNQSCEGTLDSMVP